MRARVRVGAERRGGVLGYPLKQLYEEVAFVAYHFHWQPEAVLNLDHSERRRWVNEISAINQRMNEASR
jgi:Family of unknown function (DUF6760)